MRLSTVQQKKIQGPNIFNLEMKFLKFLIKNSEIPSPLFLSDLDMGKKLGTVLNTWYPDDGTLYTPGTVWSDGFYTDISNQRQVQQYI